MYRWSLLTTANIFCCQKASNELRVTWVPSSAAADNVDLVSRAAWVALRDLPGMLSKSFLTKLVKEENYAEISAGTKTLRDLEVNVCPVEACMCMAIKLSDALL